MNNEKENTRRGTGPIIDWHAIHLRLEKVQATMERGFASTPEERKKILKARAQMLARESAKPEVADESLEVVEFLIANETYGIESAYVGEVYPLRDLTPLPCTPPYVHGIINVRGHIVSVIDIKKFFDLPEKGLSDLNKVIVVHNDAIELGVLADALMGVRSVPLREIQPSLPTLTGIRAEYLKGVSQERLILLDIEKFLADEKIIVHEEVKT